ncbi:MAG: hypothetical protein JWN13_3442 [Betaproteobacteria bacterium]|nr:hypothetical protein [Betaproteobacteria bacterium]
MSDDGTAAASGRHPRACRAALAEADVDRAIALIRDLENVPDVTEIMQLLTPVES